MLKIGLMIQGSFEMMSLFINLGLYKFMFIYLVRFFIYKLYDDNRIDLFKKKMIKFKKINE